MKLSKVLVVHNIEGCQTTRHVTEVLDKYDISCTVIHRTHLDKTYFSNQDLVIVVGGDGTVLRTSHFILDDTPLLAINCDVRKNEGFFMRANRDNFERRLKLILSGKHKILKLSRLKVLLNNKVLPELCLNDVYLGDHKAYHTSRYWLNGEYQKSSGIIVATPAGTNGWYKSLGGKPLPLASGRFAFIVREPYQGRLVRFRKIKGILGANQKLSVVSDIYDGILVFDSVSKEYRFCTKDKAVVSLADKPLRLVEF